MPLAYVLDENLRGPLWHAIGRHNSLGFAPIDALRVGDPPDLPLGTLDPDLLRWAERAGRVVVTLDRSTLPADLADHLRSGRHSPGVFVIRQGRVLPEVVEYLAIAAHLSDRWEWEDRCEFIP